MNYLIALLSLLVVYVVANTILVIYRGFFIGKSHKLAHLIHVRDEDRASFRLKTRLAYYTDCAALFKEAYEKYTKQGKICVIPGLGLRDEVILPTQWLGWATALPDNVLNAHSAFREIDQADYNAPSHEYITDAWPGLMVKRDMSRVLEAMVKAMGEEITVAFDQNWGTDTKNWTEVNLSTTLRRIIGQASGRFTVGLPLCRDPEYITVSSSYGDWFVINAGLLALMPKFLKPVLGRVTTIPNRYYEYRTSSLLRTLYKERLALLNQGPEEKGDATEPQDLFQMMLRYAQSSRPNDLPLKRLGARVALANFGSVHQTSLAASNLVLNMIDSDAQYNTIATIRAEMDTVLGHSADQNPASLAWTKANVAKMVQTDSLMRETMRCHSFGNRSNIRTVVPPEGLIAPDGTLLPQGAMVSFLAYNSQQDGDMVADPDKFDPFRFSRLRQQAADAAHAASTPADASAADGTTTDKSKAAGFAFVSTGPSNLPFGHGRRACPGRFLLEFELKILLACIVARYDIELAPKHGGVRPPTRWVSETMMPPGDATIRVRRKA